MVNTMTKMENNHEPRPQGKEPVQSALPEKETSAIAATPIASNMEQASPARRASRHVAFRSFVKGGEEEEEEEGSAAATTTTTSTGNSLINTEVEEEAEASSSNPHRDDNENLGNNTNASSDSATSPASPPSSPKRRRNRRKAQRKVDTTQKWKHRKRGRLVRVVSVENIINDANVMKKPSVFKLPQDDESGKQSSEIVRNFPPLPSNQYIAKLRRRAVRKLKDKPETPTTNKNQNDTMDKGDKENEDEEEEYGDISLGMKLQVVGGRVIVQTLNALADGRASPAQLAGNITRGDVLLAIGNLSLVNLPVDQLMDGLKPLSAPAVDGKYQRVLHLRFEAGVGLDLLVQHEEQSKSYRPYAANPDDMMPILFPMVDQLSGAPLFDQEMHQPLSPPSPPKIKAEESQQHQNDEEDTKMSITVSLAESGPDTIISTVISREHNHEREVYTSKFFNWKREFPVLLQKVEEEMNHHDPETTIVGMTPSDRIELGKVIMKLTKSLTIRMQDVDRGKDMRSFKTWSSNFSLRSSASARRRVILDSASLRSHRAEPPSLDEDDSDEESIDASGSLDGVDGDALLLGLAAHDGIWRKQVIEALKEAIGEMNNDILAEEKEEDVEGGKGDGTGGGSESLAMPDIDRALTRDLSTFLFGENMSRIITKKKKSHALPPEEITTVLFDLTTYIATSAPDEITVFGGVSQNPSFTSGFGTYGGKQQKASQKADMLLANRFVLDQALPEWLNAFKPFPLQQRRVLWPRALNEAGGGGVSTLASDGDSLTVESVGSMPKSPGRAKDLREIIEDQNLDIETRAETCFLVTYYFTQQLLSQYQEIADEERDELDEKVSTFVKQYGAYLQIHSCLAFSATVRAQAAITELLKAASYDPTHRDAVKEIQRGKTLTFYEANKLSALLTFLVSIRYEPKEERREFIRGLCVSAYPDTQPWQVRLACLDVAVPDDETRKPCEPEAMKELYYKYLSSLLDPIEGHDAARHNADLVKEWCAFSLGYESNGEIIQPNVQVEHKKNFLAVASRASSSHLAYKRDLIMLLNFSMEVGDRNLALDLLGEILDNRKLLCKQEIPVRLLECLRQLGLDALRLANDTTTEKTGFHELKRVLLLFHRMSTSATRICRESIVVAEEIQCFLIEWEGILGSNERDSHILVLVDFVVKESTPRDVLAALVLWSSSRTVGDLMYSRIDALLQRGVERALRTEVSGSLLRLKHAREGFTDDNKVALSPSLKVATSKMENSIWKRLSLGSLSIDK